MPHQPGTPHPQANLIQSRLILSELTVYKMVQRHDDYLSHSNKRLNQG